MKLSPFLLAPTLLAPTLLAPTLLAFALFGCSAASDAGVNGDRSVSSDDPPIMAPNSPDLEGTWQVVRLDGSVEGLQMPSHQPLVTFSGNRIHFQSQCIYSDWIWSRKGAATSTEPYYEPGTAMCARGLSNSETAIQNAFTGLKSITAATGELVIEGGGHRLELRKTDDTAQAQPPADLLAGEWLVAALDGRAFGQTAAIALKGDGRTLLWEPSCAGQYRNYQIEGSRFRALPNPDTIREVCEIGYPPELPQVWAALAAADRISTTPIGGVEISGGGHSVVLQRF